MGVPTPCLPYELAEFAHIIPSHAGDGLELRHKHLLAVYDFDCAINQQLSIHIVGDSCCFRNISSEVLQSIDGTSLGGLTSTNTGVVRLSSSCSS